MVEPFFRVRPASLRRRRLGPLGWHAVYFSILCLIASVIFYAVGKRKGAQAGEKLDYLDAVFLGVTSATGAGLGNVVLSRLGVFQQVIAFMLILLGSQVWIAACVVNVQRALLARKIQRRCLEEAEKRKKEAGKAQGGEGMEKQDAEKTDAPPSPPVVRVSPVVENSVPQANGGVTAAIFPSGAPTLGAPQGCTSPCTTVASSANTSNVDLLETSRLRGPNRDASSQALIIPTAAAVTSRNGSNVDLLKQNESDYEDNTLLALTTLSWLLPTYLVVFQMLGTILIGSWVSHYGRDIVAVNNLNPWWFAAFNSVSAFNNSGMSLLDANMAPFATRGSLVVWVQCILILAGNSCFPICLKAILRLFPSNGGLALLLLRSDKNAHRIFPYLFSTRETRWLIAMLIILNTIDWTIFEILAPATPSVFALPVARRILAGLFQAFSVRSGGFAIVAIRELHTGTLMAYTVMLYISAFPITLPEKKQRDLDNAAQDQIDPEPGIAGKEPSVREFAAVKETSARSFVAQQLRGLMRAGDLRYLAAAVWLICVIDGIGEDGVFAVVFEVASAFGCVGVSFGSVKDGRLALVGDWRGGSKLVLAAVMLWGRVREVRRGILVGWGEEEEGEGKVMSV
ncbi:TrkH-domain-containing protein [Wilcoxina mikolae CBS 423.85]|nr:TrkH-domain-containing protein [Wilcoxina mikolae CBS 423.85]